MMHLHFRLPVLAAVALLLNPAAAVFADEAWSIDYHYALLGLPKEDTTLFHRPNPSSKASLIYTLSEQGVLGAVNPRDGSIVWRQWLQPNITHSSTSFLRAGEGQDVVVSGTDRQVSAWSAADGKLVWTHAAHDLLMDVEILELNDGRDTTGAKDAIVMTNGEHPMMQRLDGASGALKWTYSIDNGDLAYQVSASSTQVFAILLHKTMLGKLKIKVISLDPVTGRKTDEYTLNSESELASADTIVAVGANSASPIIAWTDAAHSTLKVNIIGTKGISTFDIDKHNGHEVTRVRLHAPYHTNSLAHFLVHYETEVSHWGEVFHVDLVKSKIAKAYALPKLSGKGVFSTSTVDANVYFTRITTEQILTVSSKSHGVLGKWPLSSLEVGAPADEEIRPVHAVAEVSTKGDVISAVRSAVLLSTGDWILVREGSPVWQRPEILASTLSATYAVLPEVEAFARELKIEAHSNAISAYMHRLMRHIQDLQRLPQILAGFPQRITSGLFGTTADDGATGDIFGFHQIVACVTAGGRVIALDAGSPNKILWSRQALNLKHGEISHPIAEPGADGTLVVRTSGDQQAVRLNASTGEIVPSADPAITTAVPAGAIQFRLQNGEFEAYKAGSSHAGALWHFATSDAERTLRVVPRPVNDPVASIGKELGDRRVLYKYLSPNLALLSTANDKTQSASFYVLDTISGATLYSDIHNNVDLNAPIPTIMSENWFAYSYTSEASENTPKGHHLIVGEMFESLMPNDRGPLTGKINSSSLTASAEPVVQLRSYQIPEEISKLAVTRTRQGITSRQLLAVLSESDAIVGIPYAAIDPRRPAGRDPTKDEQMEGLVRYAPTIDFDPKWMLNHQREVIGISEVVTSPALIESTSLVFAYGLDIFGTRLSPSFSFDILGKNFNKFQMLATVAALAVATFVVAPLVTRKQVNARWQYA